MTTQEQIDEILHSSIDIRVFNGQDYIHFTVQAKQAILDWHKQEVLKLIGKDEDVFDAENPTLAGIDESKENAKRIRNRFRHQIRETIEEI